MKKIFILVALLLWASSVKAQYTGTARPIYFNGAPGGGCSPAELGIDYTTGDMYRCSSGAWVLFSHGSGSTGVTTTGTPTTGNPVAFSGSATITNATGHNEVIPLICKDTSGSGTVQTCNTAPSYTPVAGDSIIYETTTSNSGDLTVNVNSLGAVHVRKWQAAAVLASGDLAAGIYMYMTYDGTYWELYTIGNPPSGGGSGSAPWNTMLAPTSVTPPVMSGFTLGSSGATGTSNSANAGGAIFMFTTTAPGGDNVAFYYKATPGGTWTLTLGFIPQVQASAWGIAGIVIRDGVGGKLEAMWIGCNTTGPVMYTVARYNSYTSFSSSTNNSDTAWLGPVVWEQLQYDGTHYFWKLSPDGQSWTTVFTETPTSFLANAANELGFGFDPISDIAGMLVVDWSGI
jgi:hypothetical protein